MTLLEKETFFDELEEHSDADLSSEVNIVAFVDKFCIPELYFFEKVT